MSDPPVTVRRLDTDRQDCFAFEIKGHLEDADMENIYGLLEGAIQLHPRLDALLRISEYEGIDLQAAMRDWSLLGRRDVLEHVKRYAVIGGPSWMAATLAAAKPFTSLEIKHFSLEEETAAWEWLGAHEIPEQI